MHGFRTIVPSVPFRDKGKEKKEKREAAVEAKEMHENLTENQIDKTLQDGFPASDPPAWHSFIQKHA